MTSDYVFFYLLYIYCTNTILFMGNVEVISSICVTKEMKVSIYQKHIQVSLSDFDWVLLDIRKFQGGLKY